MKNQKLPHALLGLSLLFYSAAGFSESRSPIQENTLSALEFMRGVYGSTYAPAPWKAQKFEWNLNKEIDRNIQAVLAAKDLKFPEARRILMNFIYSMKDYHVSIQFQNTESASLPLMVKSAGEKYYFAWIDRTKLPQSSFPYSVGDEIVTFGGVATAEEVKRVKAEIPGNVEQTDASLAELNLTRRRASRGYAVPRGPITLGILPNGSQVVENIQMIWDYEQEEAPVQGVLADEVPGKLSGKLIAPSMDVRFFEHPSSLSAAEAANPHLVGGRNSFTPKLGKVLWESPESDPFNAYLFQGANGKLYGYVRIPSYVPEDLTKALESFSATMERFEGTADALVIDQVNNPGGSVFYLYSLVSMLIDRPVATPRHRMSITQADVIEAASNLKLLAKVTDTESAKKIIGESIGGYPVNWEVAQFLREYFRFLISEWRAGRSFSQPFWIAGVDHINPNPVHFSKPILILTNALDFSGGDFFPAILQDNKRAVIFGTRTAGAGGYVNDVEFPNLLGISSFRVTQSLAYRVEGGKIENDGVTPDVSYSMSVADLTQGYREYKTAILKALEAL